MVTASAPATDAKAVSTTATAPAAATGLVVRAAATPDPAKAASRVTWMVEVRNSSRRAVTLDFATDQRADVVLLRDDGREAYRWSTGRTFAPTAARQRLEPGARKTYRLRGILDVAPGTYQLVANLSSDPSPPPGRRTIEVIVEAGEPSDPVDPGHGPVVSANPVDWTPAVLDGLVDAVAQVGNRMVVGGSFTQVRQAGRSTALSRPYLFAFDARTGVIDPGFVPAPNGPVAALAAAPDGRSVFVGGRFSHIAGRSAGRLAKLDVATGRPVAGFRANASAAVEDLAVSGGRLFLAGSFTAVGGAPRTGLAAVDVTTGALDPGLDLPFTDPRPGKNEAAPVTTASLKAIDVSPDGSRLVATGNFTRVAGQDRYQIAVVDVGTAPARLADWHTDRYRAACSSTFPTYMRDVDVSEDGAYFVVVTTGARSAPTLCDTAARWELSPGGTPRQPTWVDHTGGDTLTAVAVTDAAVYVGGHQRYMNNPFNHGTGLDAEPGPGAVARSGIAALDPANGLPLSWNPGRTRGVGVFALVPTPAGLWVGSDTESIGGERRPRLALLPLAGGTTAPAAAPDGLPGDLYRLGPNGGSDLVRQPFDGEAAGAPTPVPTAVDWSSARGAFLVNGQLYAGWSDGRLDVRSFDGAILGPPTLLDRRGLEGSRFPVATLTGMFFDRGRLYYTVSGDRRLLYRYFTPESGVLGAQSFVASGGADGLDWSDVQGLTYASGRLYFARPDGHLHRIDFARGRPVPGTSSVVAPAGPSDGGTWVSQGLFIRSQ
jgi:hypothetical protein